MNIHTKLTTRTAPADSRGTSTTVTHHNRQYTTTRPPFPSLLLASGTEWWLPKPSRPSFVHSFPSRTAYITTLLLHPHRLPCPALDHIQSIPFQANKFQSKTRKRTSACSIPIELPEPLPNASPGGPGRPTRRPLALRSAWRQ